MKMLTDLFDAFLASTHFAILAKMAMAMLLGGIIGLERELKRKAVDTIRHNKFYFINVSKLNAVCFCKTACAIVTNLR
ncbi:hypothetical protein ACI3OZ_11140, partial [Glaesserella parasuis]